MKTDFYTGLQALPFQQLSLQKSCPQKRPAQQPYQHNPACPHQHKQQGFTLLEVMIALTITAMVLGSLFALAAGSKQLAFRTQNSLHQSTAARAAVNFALLDNEFRDIEPAFENDRYEINGLDLLPDAERRTAPTNDLLQEYSVENVQTGEVINAVRWQRFELPQ